MAINITELDNKVENKGETAQGKLTAAEFNTLVSAVKENQTSAADLTSRVSNAEFDINKLDEDSKTNVKSITYKARPYKPGPDGNVVILDSTSRYSLSAVYSSDRLVVTPEDSFKLYAEISHQELQTGPDGSSTYQPSANPVTVDFYFGSTGAEVLVHSEEAYHGDKVEFDFKDFLDSKIDRPKAYIEVSNGISSDRSLPFSLTILDVKLFLSSDFDETKIQREDSWTLGFTTTTPDGITPTIHIQIDENLPKVLTGQSGSHRPGSVLIEDKKYNGGRSGSRHLKVWADVTYTPPRQEPVVVATKPVEAEYIYINSSDSSEEVFLASNAYEITSIPRYENLIFRYWMFQKNFALEKETEKLITLYISNTENGEPINDLKSVQKVTFFKETSELSYWTIALLGTKEELEGKKYIIVDVGGKKYNFPFTIVAPEAELTQDPSYEVYLTSAGRKNTDINKNIWECRNSKNTATYRMEGLDKLDFSDTGSGWRTNTDGSTYLHLRKGNFITLNYKPFAQPITFGQRGKGLSISFEIAVKNSTNKNAVAVSCIGEDATGKKIGVELKANEAAFYGQDGGMSCEYRENDRVRVDFIIDGTQRDYVSDNGMHWNESLAWLYLDGVYQRIFQIPESANYQQIDPKVITFGSNECDVDLYTVRVYEKALTVRSLLDNYAYDMPVPTLKAAIQKRNAALVPINEKGDISVDERLLKQARPDLPIMYWDLNGKKLPIAKKPFLLMDITTYDNPTKIMGEDTVTDAALSKLDYSNATFTVGDLQKDPKEVPGGFLACQGSSSMRYPSPYKNYDWRTSGDLPVKSKFDFRNGVKADKYSLYPGMPPIKKITFKKDYASSEMVNNIICSELFSDMAQGMSSPGCVSPTQEITGDYVKYRLSLKGIPMFVFYNKETEENPEGVRTPLGMFNMIPNKKEVDYLGFTEFQDPAGHAINTTHEGFDEETLKPLGNEAQSWEIRDNFEFMAETFEPAKWDYDIAEVDNPKFNPELPEGPENPKKVKEKIWSVKSVFNSYETRTPGDSFLSYKIKDGERDYKDFGEHTDATYTDAEWQALSPEMKTQLDKDLDKSRAECETLRIFHNFVASCNPDKVVSMYDDNYKEKAESLVSMAAIAADPENPLCEKYKTYSVLLNAKASPGSLSNDAYKDILGNVHTHDTKEYRLGKFQTEAEKHWSAEKEQWVDGGHMRLNQWILYYIWMEQFWMMDSGSKNLQLYTMGRHRVRSEEGSMGESGKAAWIEDPTSPYEWGVMVRDADTGLGIDNQGKFAFPPYLEDVDYYAPTIADFSKRFEYNHPEDLDNSKKDPAPLKEGFKVVLNGQAGVMWKNLRKCYGGPNDKIANLYREAIINDTNTKFSYEQTTKKFEDYQEKWAESLYDFGSVQYHGSQDKAAWMTSGLGDKKHQRRNWLYYGFRYRMSKYHVQNAEKITMKLKNPTSSMQLNTQTYTPIYTRTTATNFSNLEMVNYHRHVDLNQPAKIVVPATGDAEIMWYLADGDLFTDLGNLYEIGGTVGGINSFTAAGDFRGRLKSLRFGNHKNKKDYKNEELNEVSYVAFPELEELDLTNCTALGTSEKEKHSLKIAELGQLKNLYLENTSYYSVDLPKTPSLKKVWMNPGLTNIILEDLPNLEEFTIGEHTWIPDLEHPGNGEFTFQETYDYKYTEGEGKEAHTVVVPDTPVYHRVEKISIKNCPNINSYSLVSKSLQYGKIASIELDTLNWTECSVDTMKKLTQLKKEGKDVYLSGHINLIGNVTFEIKEEFKEVWGDIDDPENFLYLTYETVKILNVETPKKINFTEPKDMQLTFKVNGNDYESWSWSIEDNLLGATISPTGLLHVERLGSEFDEPLPIVHATITIRKKTSIVTGKVELHLYRRDAQPGYYVFNDGTFGPEKEEGKTVVGVCFYVDPKNRNHRLMMALDELRKFSGKPWGPGSNSITDFKLPGDAGFVLNEIPGFEFEDLKTYPDMELPASFTKYEGTIDSMYRGNPGEAEIDEDGFRIFNGNIGDPKRSILYSQLGWKEITEDRPLEAFDAAVRDNPDGTPIFSVKPGTSLPYGQYNTLRIIDKRDYILNKMRGENSLFAYPEATENISELGVLELSVEDAIKYGESKKEEKPNHNYESLFFPAASACYSYSPIPQLKGKPEVNLIPEFREGNWFLPSAGEVSRMRYYFSKTVAARKSQEAEEEIRKDPKNILQKAIDEKILTVPSDGYLKTSSPASNLNNYFIMGLTDTDTGMRTQQATTKDGPYFQVVPICKF